MVSDEDLLAKLPGVRVDRDNADHYRGLLEHRLLINRCSDCRAWHQPPRSVCPRCWSRAVQPEEVCGQGHIAFVTFLHQGPRAPGVDYVGGRPVAAVELVEQAGLRVSASIVDSPRETVVPGAATQLVWQERDGRPVFAFRVVANEVQPS